MVTVIDACTVIDAALANYFDSGSGITVEPLTWASCILDDTLVAGDMDMGNVRVREGRLVQFDQWTICPSRCGVQRM